MSKEILKLRKDVKIILIDGNTLPTSFETDQKETYKIAKNHLYINIEKELPKLSKQDKEYIKNNTIAIIHELEDNDKTIITEKYNNRYINKINLYDIMAIKNYKSEDISKDITNNGAIKICDLDSAIEFTENLFITSEQENIKKFRLYKALKKVLQINEEDLKNDLIKGKYLSELNIIYQYNFINRLNAKIEIIPKDNTLFNLYKSAYMYSSAYQSVLAMFDYITAMGKMVEYYLYAKNNPKFKKEVIFLDIIGDNPPIWNNHILINICNNPENVIYKNIREEKFKLTKNEEILLNVYLSNILNMNIKGNEITYDGLAEIFRQFRNRIEAHGTITDTNVYAIWNLTQFFFFFFSKVLKIDELECEYDEKENEVKIGYGNEQKIGVGKYIIMQNNKLFFIKDRKSYIDYLEGEVILKDKEQK